MNRDIKLDDRHIVEEALRSLRSDEPRIPEAHVRKFLTLIGEEIRQRGTLGKEVVDQLLEKVKTGAI